MPGDSGIALGVFLGNVLTLAGWLCFAVLVGFSAWTESLFESMHLILGARLPRAAAASLPYSPKTLSTAGCREG